MTPVRRGILVAAGCGWIAAIGLGFSLLSGYAVAAGAPASAPPEWPSASRIPAPRGNYQLVMTVHPNCPCTRASVIELNNLMSTLRLEHVKGYVLVMKPADVPDEWTQTESVRNARSIPGVDVVVDVDGVEAARLGAQTSGQVLLYGPDGRLRFAGGLTPDRGHVGDSPGRERIVSLVKTGTADAKESLVFGCPLNATVCPRPASTTKRGL